MKSRLSYITDAEFGEYWLVVAEFYHGKFISLEYPGLLANFLAKRGAKKVLDAACGIGEPGLDLALKLAEHGVSLDLSDGDESMLRICRFKAVEMGIEIPIFHSLWQDLAKKVGKYDWVLCLDSAITYVNSWTKSGELDIRKANQGILKSFRNFHRILNPGGSVIVGLGKYAFDGSNELTIDYGVQEIEGVPVRHTWELTWDFETQIKRWVLAFEFGGDTYTREMVSYMPSPDTLKNLLLEADFVDVFEQEIAPGEYDINFIARKE